MSQISDTQVQTNFYTRKRMIMLASKSFRSLVSALMLMLTVISTTYGETEEEPTERNQENCQLQNETQDNTGFPESMKIHIRPGNIKSVKIHSDVRNRSLSPWDYSIDEDPNRFPHKIAEAKCRHDACLNFTGKGLNYGMNSVRIQQEILVLKREQIGCQQIYSLEKKLVTVGCTCVFANIVAHPKNKTGRRRRELTYGGKQQPTAGRKSQLIKNILG